MFQVVVEATVVMRWFPFSLIWMRLQISRCNKYVDKNRESDHFGAGGLEQGGQGAESPATQVAQLAAMDIADRAVHAGQQPCAVLGDAGQNHAAIWILAAARDELAALQAVKKAGDVRVAGDHAAGDFAAGKALGCTAQDAENVVLGGGELLGLEQLRDAAGECVGGAQEFEVRQLLGER